MIVCYNYGQPRHLTIDFPNLCSNCTYFFSLDHVMEYKPQLLENIHEKKG